MMSSLRKVICGTAGAIAAVLVLAGPADAGPILDPDLTISNLGITYDGTNFDAASGAGGSFLSWTLPDGSFGGAIPSGSAHLTWDGTIGSFTVWNNLITL